MGNLVRWFGKKLGLRYCVTKDFDGEVRYRRIYRNPFDELVCRGIRTFGYPNVLLNDDGTCGGHCTYVKQWKEI